MNQLGSYSRRQGVAIFSIWQTISPVDCPPDSPMFVNAVVGLLPRKDESPESLLKKLQAMEKEYGRRPKKVLNEARPLDLDHHRFRVMKHATRKSFSCRTRGRISGDSCCNP